MKISVVVENNSSARMEGEAGLSLLVDTQDSTYLVDTGASSLVLKNLVKMGVSPSEIPNIVISHNHNDHIGGIIPLLEANHIARVYISENATGEYVKYKDGNLDILSDNLAIYTMTARFTEVGDMEMIGKGVAVCHVANPVEELKCRDPFLMEIVDTAIVKDEFRHEVYVAVFEKGTYSIISPCTHNGILNVIYDARRRFSRFSLNAFIGGLHLEESSTGKQYMSEEEIKVLADALNESGLKALYTCHCTGRTAYMYLEKYCNFPVKYVKTGDEFKVLPE